MSQSGSELDSAADEKFVNWKVLSGSKGIISEQIVYLVSPSCSVFRWKVIMISKRQTPSLGNSWALGKDRTSSRSAGKMNSPGRHRGHRRKRHPIRWPLIEVLHDEQKCDHWDGRERRAPQELVKWSPESKQLQVPESRVSEGQKEAKCFTTPFLYAM